MLRTIIVEDEPLSRQYIRSLLKRFPEVDLIAEATTQEDAIHLIEQLNPDLIFLDIELHTGTGFEVLRRLKTHNFYVVFTTALEDHAIKIIKLSGVLFLQKPIDADELNSYVKKIENVNQDDKQAAVSYLLETLNNNNKPLHIAIENVDGRSYVLLREVIIVQAEGKCCVLHMQDGGVIKSPCTIKEYEKLLGDFQFFRANAEQLINLAQAEKTLLTGNLIWMNTGVQVQLSSKRKELYFQKINVE